MEDVIARRKIRRYMMRQPGQDQWVKLRRLQKILRDRKNRSNKRTFEILAEHGYEIGWKRIKWTGGVGSYKVLRGGIIRVSVAATRSGMRQAEEVEFRVAPGITSSRIEPGKRRGYRYGYCVEI